MLVAGICLVILALATPFTMDRYVKSSSIKGTEICAENEELWSQMLVGQKDVEILQDFFLYNCTNYEDVVYRGATPEYQEVGPFTYKEVNEYTEIQYGNLAALSAG